MSSTTSEHFFLGLPDKRPSFQRDYTSSPPESHLCTPQTSHGFIPLGSASPTPASADDRTKPLSFDYFSISKKESIISPDAVVYEPHGFIPLCSVAPVAKADEAGDYFSGTITRETYDDQSSAKTTDELNIRAAKTSTKTSECESKFNTPTPRLCGLVDTSLIHPTGSPVHSRDILYCPEQMRKLVPTIRPQLRGGGVYDPFEKATKLEH
ncbi:hypothetical protein BDU57DRAFT_537650 [Ampelomyces quisqualis]|uniref:Uncharacterized protein n=1 Tax=Ampelomyces quisqualis TaxID=50730 RepID=A0A6A5QRP0_AMPQU|nr:hypothetical protein BDU57DRAFT_537650 [Ampelomyces quisqualis]